MKRKTNIIAVLATFTTGVVIGGLFMASPADGATVDRPNPVVQPTRWASKVPVPTYPNPTRWASKVPVPTVPNPTRWASKVPVPTRTPSPSATTEGTCK